MSQDAGARAVYRRRFPRVSGDEPPVTLTLALDDLFSPRERG